MHELHGQPVAQLDGVHVALAGPWEGGEEEAHGEGVVQVPQGIYECGVPAWPGGRRSQGRSAWALRGPRSRCPTPGPEHAIS